MPGNPSPPVCIAVAIHAALVEFHSRQDGPLLTDTVAQAVWDALLTEGHVCKHYWRRTGVLVLPLGVTDA